MGGSITNKEFGSDFHLCTESKWQTNNQNFFLKNTTLFLSGRTALYALLKQGIKKHNWKTVYFPSYYCQEVVKFIQDLTIDVKIYDFNPFLDTIDKDFKINDNPTSVIINVDFFGLKHHLFLSIKKAVLIDDLTHNLEAIKTSTADYIFGSLRKELPIPSGGFLASSNGFKLPKGKQSRLANSIAIKKFTAMYLKKRYLEGLSNDKDTFREIFIESEENLEGKLKSAKIPKTAKVLLQNLDITQILKAKKENINQALSNLKIDKDLVLNSQKTRLGAGLVLQLKSKKNRDELKSYLISKKIYPAVLWPGQLTKRDIEIEDKVLFLHLDYRYNTEDINLIINKLNFYFSNE